jgi:geranyl diphosphate 2-C-methyltransferase
VNWFGRVAALYDSKRKDFNWRLAADGIIHHHNGLVSDRAAFMRKVRKGGAAAEKAVHESETALSRFGFRFLGRLKPGATLLDAGCGRGGSSLLLAARYPRLAIRGFTLSSYQASAARAAARRRGCSDRVKFFRGSMLALPARAGSFDAVWACESTEHVPDMGDFFRETARVAKPGARLVIIAWVRNAGHRLGRKYAALANEAYVTKIHAEREYLEGAQGTGWELARKEDLTGPTAAYWAGRAALKSGSGTESFMAPGFASRALLYRLYAYRLKK